MTPPEPVDLEGLEIVPVALPVRWEDEYDFREHAAHKAEGLDADCENIAAGRIRLVAADGAVVLAAWAEHADDLGLDLALPFARWLVALVNAAPALLAELRAAREARLMADTKVSMLAAMADGCRRERDAAREAWRETNAHLDQAIEDRDDARDAFDAAREEVARLRGAARALLDLRAEVPATYEDAYEFTFKGWGREKWEALAALAPRPAGEEG